MLDAVDSEVPISVQTKATPPPPTKPKPENLGIEYWDKFGNEAITAIDPDGSNRTFIDNAAQRGTRALVRRINTARFGAALQYDEKVATEKMKAALTEQVKQYCSDPDAVEITRQGDHFVLKDKASGNEGSGVLTGALRAVSTDTMQVDLRASEDPKILQVYADTITQKDRRESQLSRTLRGGMVAAAMHEVGQSGQANLLTEKIAAKDLALAPRVQAASHVIGNAISQARATK